MDEDGGSAGQHHGAAGRAGEPGTPREPLGAARQERAVLGIGARRHEAVEIAARKLGAQRREAFDRRRASVQAVVAGGLRGADSQPGRRQEEGVIVAIKTNRRHTIFRGADDGIVGDWETFLPPLVEALKPVLAGLG